MQAEPFRSDEFELSHANVSSGIGRPTKLIKHGLYFQDDGTAWRCVNYKWRVWDTAEKLFDRNESFIDLPAYKFVTILHRRVLRAGVYRYDVNFQHNVRTLGYYEYQVRVNGIPSTPTKVKKYWGSSVPDTVEMDGTLALTTGDTVNVVLWANVETAVRSGSWMSLKLLQGG